MPLFDYKCPKCNTVREVLIHTNSTVDVLCTETHRKQVVMVRMPSAPASFKIKGFSSVNDYSRTDTGWQKSSVPGVRTRVQDGSKGEE